MKRKKKRSLFWLVLPVLVLAALSLGPRWMKDGVRTGAEETIAAFCKAEGLRLSDYPDELVALLERNPETEEFVLRYPLDKDRESPIDLSEYADDAGVPLFLQWDRQWGYLDYGGKCAALTGCGPVCLSMAAYYLTGDEAFTPDKMIRFAGENDYYVKDKGSKWTLISEGAQSLGFEVTELPLVKSRIFRELEAGNPIICVMGPGDFTTSGHFIVLVGAEDGLLRVNDPNSREKSAKLWKFEDIEDQFRNLWVIRK